MGTSDWIGIAGVAVGLLGVLAGSIIGTIQIKRANIKELSFPVKNPHASPCFIEPFDKNAIDLQDFIFKNKQKRVFLNVIFMDNNASFHESEGMDPSICFHVDKLENFDHVEISPRTDNSMALELIFKGIDGSCANVYSWHGQIKINGYFTIIETGGPHMGSMWATMKADKPN